MKSNVDDTNEVSNMKEKEISKTNNFEQYYDLLRYYLHEQGNILATFQRTTKYLDLIARGSNIDKKKLLSIVNDAKNDLEMQYLISENVYFTLFSDEIPYEHKNKFDLSLLIYKWESVRRRDINDKNCEFIYKNQAISIDADPRYIEIIIYNLISNAVKYALEGTRIYADCKRDKDNNKKIVLSTRNFSFEIPAEERKKIFLNGYRSTLARQYMPDGNGIGLWLSRKIARQYKGDVVLKKHIKISNYNVPLLKKLIETKELQQYFSLDELNKYQQEYDLLCKKKTIHNRKKVQLLDYIVSDWEIEPLNVTKHKIYALLNMPTYLVHFEAILFDN